MHAYAEASPSAHAPWTRFRWRRPKAEDPATAPGGTVVADGGRWRALVAPLRWEPLPGDVLTGTFAGFLELQGAFGSYRAVLLVHDARSYLISGKMLVSLISANDVEIGEAVRIVYAGTGVSNVTGHPYKKFEAFVAS